MPKAGEQITLAVSESDIAAAEVSTINCPICRAVKRCHGAYRVCTQPSGAFLATFSANGPEFHFKPVGGAASQFCFDFDRGQAVSPIHLHYNCLGVYRDPWKPERNWLQRLLGV